MAASRIVCRAAASPSSAIEAVDSLAGTVEDAIRESVGNCLLDTDLGVGTKKKGKVRDTYDLGDRVLIVTTDRQSAFDRILAAVPFKGQVLNQTSAWWMDATSHIVGNALLGLPDPNVALMKKCQVFPVEFVVRGFMTGSTDTSLWTHYSAGARSYCGHSFPDGLVKNQRLACNVVTPTTKAETGDVPISGQEIVERGLMSKSDFDQVAKAALALFNFGQQQAESRGLLLVDTKYEFGKDADGNILLVDEIHTPDSSRYWIESTFQQRLAEGLEPQNIDKEFLRLWFRQHCDPYKDEVLPEAPTDLVVELSRRYVYLYQKITGQEFVPEVLAGVSPAERIKRNVQQQLL